MATSSKSFTYVWQGVDRRGQKTSGMTTATNPTVVKVQLRKQGIVAKSVKRKTEPLFGGGKKKIKPMDIAVFTRQMATMLKAGVPLIQSFEIVADGTDHKAVQDLVLDIKNEVASGSGFAATLRKHPRYFDDLFCSLVDSGEQSGTLEVMLDRVATYKEKTEALKAKIKKALTYPTAVIVVAIAVTALLLIKVVPTFADTFESFGSDLPAFTLMVVNLSEWMQANWMMLFGGIIVAGFGFREAKRRSRAFSDFLDKMMLKLPIIGDILRDAVVARFSRTLSTTFAAGVPLVDALDSVSGAAGNVVYYDAIRQIRDEVTSGQNLYVAIRNTQLFPNLLLQMVSIGEESGTLDEMLEKVANHYESEVDNAVDNLTALLEPFIMSVLGILVGGLMVAMYLPIFMLGTAM